MTKARFDSGVDGLWKILDTLGDQADRATVLKLAEVRKALVDRLLALPSYSAQPGGPEVIPSSFVSQYLVEVERVLDAWLAVSGQNSLAVSADLAASGYSSLLRELTALPPTAGHGITGLTPDLAVAATHYRTAALGGVAAGVSRETAEQVQGIIFGTRTRWDAVRAIRSALATGDDGLGKYTAQATRIERTALMTVFNAAGSRALSSAAEDIPGLMKEWSAADQPRTCPRCRALDGRRVGPSGEFGRDLSSPPAHWNCRCRLVAWVPGWEDE